MARWSCAPAGGTLSRWRSSWRSSPTRRTSSRPGRRPPRRQGCRHGSGGSKSFHREQAPHRAVQLGLAILLSFIHWVKLFFAPVGNSFSVLSPINLLLVGLCWCVCCSPRCAIRAHRDALRPRLVRAQARPVDLPRRAKVEIHGRNDRVNATLLRLPERA